MDMPAPAARLRGFICRPWPREHAAPEPGPCSTEAPRPDCPLAPRGWSGARVTAAFLFFSCVHFTCQLYLILIKLHGSLALLALLFGPRGLRQAGSWAPLLEGAGWWWW